MTYTHTHTYIHTCPVCADDVEITLTFYDEMLAEKGGKKPVKSVSTLVFYIEEEDSRTDTIEIFEQINSELAELKDIGSASPSRDFSGKDSSKNSGKISSGKGITSPFSSPSQSLKSSLGMAFFEKYPLGATPQESL